MISTWCHPDVEDHATSTTPEADEIVSMQTSSFSFQDFVLISLQTSYVSFMGLFLSKLAIFHFN